MVSFSCEGCGDVLTKKKLDPHRNQCHGASFTCLDCMVHFQGNEYRAHTSCISEAQKYQGALYRPEKEKKNRNNNNNNNNHNSNSNTSQALVPHKAYVEDADEYNNSQLAIVAMPEAPEPPSAAPEFAMGAHHVNVFDFLVAETPNASHMALPVPESMMIEDAPQENNDRELVRVHFEDYRADNHDDYEEEYQQAPNPAFVTPAPKQQRERERRKEKKDHDLTRQEKKDKKRKRLHVETRDLSPKEGDEEMTDAPPVLHSGLTGGLKGLLARPSVFPPSPDYSGGDAEHPSPGSPIKKTKQSKRGRSRVNTISNNLMALISTRREHSSEERPKRKHRKHRDISAKSSRKLIEYKPMHDNGAIQHDVSQLVVYKPRSEMLLEFVKKGPESDRGMSMHKALKRYHRERNATGNSLSKADEEKALWRSLRMKRNDQGEIVLFI